MREWGAIGLQEKLTFANMSKSNSLIIPCALHFFIKKEKIQANKSRYLHQLQCNN